MFNLSNISSSSIAQQRLIDGLRKALVMTDDLAFENVTYDEDGYSILDEYGNPMAGHFPGGGPFGAALAVSLEDGSLEIIGKPRGNNVVGSGIASRHAEDRALQPDNFQSLIFKLNEHLREGRVPMVWMISSGQSCTTCHTKQEIMARDLMSRGLIKPGHFGTLYGASYDDTFKIAQFYDAQYADAIVLAARDTKNSGNLIQHQHIQYAQAPEPIRKLLRDALKPTAAVFRNGEVYAVGIDERGPFDLYSTAEVNAVRAACLRNRTEGAFSSWDIDGTLYTTNRYRGPLLFAEAGWTKISTIVTIEMPPTLIGRQFESLETINLGNRDFFTLVSHGYLNADSAIRVFRDNTFKNHAQPMWARVLAANQQILYNGAAVSDKVLSMRKHTRVRFSAPDITHLGAPSGRKRPLLLAKL